MKEDHAGYVIETKPNQLSDSGEWTVEVTIEKHHGDRVETRPFSAGKPTFKTREDAQRASIVLGKKIINGEFPDFSVTDL